MNFDKHLFISYAHADNLPTPDDDKGWVTRFHEYLESYLRGSMDEEPKIWRDDRLRGNDIFENEILKQFRKTAILVSILSPRYLESEWCLREVNEFSRVAEENGGLTVDDKARVLRAMLKKIPAERRVQLPGILKNALGYEFYQEADGNREILLDPYFGKEIGEAYRRRIYFLAEDIADLINKLKQKDKGRPLPEPPSKPTVYLAECGYDLRNDREKIRGELRAHGYITLPDQFAPLPDLETDYIGEVGRLLDRCQLSVHLIGKSPGKVPDGPSHKSVVQLQNEVAAKKSEEAGLRRVIWLPEGTGSEQPEQQDFIEALQKVADLQRGADLVRADLETLKVAVHAALQKLEKPEPSMPDPDGGKFVYLICDERDREATMPVRRFLKGQGLDAKIPVFEGDAAKMRQANQDSLTECDAVILFYGAGDEAWKRTVENDLKKMKGYRGGKPLVASYTYLAEPATADKRELIELEEPNLINGLEGFSEAGMKPLLKTLQVLKAGQAA